MIFLGGKILYSRHLQYTEQNIPFFVCPARPRALQPPPHITTYVLLGRSRRLLLLHLIECRFSSPGAGKQSIQIK